MCRIAITGEGRVSTDKVSIIVREIGAIKDNPRLHKHVMKPRGYSCKTV